MIKVLIIDDSAFMRKAVATLLTNDPHIQIVAQAKNGQEGLELIQKHDPDVVTLDIEMPVMDGLTTLKHIMQNKARPVLMVSSLTTQGAKATFQAMELGAADFISKDFFKVSLNMRQIGAELIAKVKTIASRGGNLSEVRTASFPKQAESLQGMKGNSENVLEGKGKCLRNIVAIGVSTGGPPAVQKILADLPEGFPASILIAQHMPAAFTRPFAERLNSISKLHVKEAQDGEKLMPGCAYVAPGGQHLSIVQKGTYLELVVSVEPLDAVYKPSADILIDSVAKTVGKRALGLILTGMGADGMLGIKALKAAGGLALAQSDSTCVVYGMPKAVIEAKLVDEVVHLDAMADAIVKYIYAT